MKRFLALAFLAAICAAVELEPVELPEPVVPYVDQTFDEPVDPVNVVDSPDDFNVNVVDSPDGYIPEDNLRVNFVDSPDWGYIPDDNLRVNVVEFPEVYSDDNVAYEPVAPSELESLRVNMPQEVNNQYPFRPIDHPMWR